MPLRPARASTATHPPPSGSRRSSSARCETRRGGEDADRGGHAGEREPPDPPGAGRADHDRDQKRQHGHDPRAVGRRATVHQVHLTLHFVSREQAFLREQSFNCHGAQGHLAHGLIMDVVNDMGCGHVFLSSVLRERLGSAPITPANNHIWRQSP